MRITDIAREALAGLGTRPSRAMIAVAGTAVGVASLVGVVGIAETAGNQVTDQLGTLEATQLQVAPHAADDERPASLPDDAPARALERPGVVAAATRASVRERVPVLAVPQEIARPSDARVLPLLAASPGIVDVAEGRLASGRFFDEGHDRRGDPVGVLGAAAARRLGISTVGDGRIVTVDGVPIVVIGILATAPYDPELPSALIVPPGIAHTLFDATAPTTLVVRTEPGAAGIVGRQLPYVLAPNRTAAFRVSVTPGRPDVREGIDEDLQTMAGFLAATVLVGSAFAIANLGLAGVMERTEAIGLLRTLGAQPWHVGAQFLVEAALIGLLGGLWGLAGGFVAIVVAATTQGWVPVLPAWTPPGAILVGIGVGVFAGWYPAVRAAKIEPARALRG